MAVAGDLQKAFLQVRVREAERDALRFHWIVDLQSTEIETLRFTRVVFGLAPSPFLLNGVIQQHLESMESRYPESVMEVRKSLYVDDLISGRSTKEEAKQLKCDAVEIFDEAKFKLHKWHSNVLIPALVPRLYVLHMIVTDLLQLLDNILKVIPLKKKLK